MTEKSPSQETNEALLFLKDLNNSLLNVWQRMPESRSDEALNKFRKNWFNAISQFVDSFVGEMKVASPEYDALQERTANLLMQVKRAGDTVTPEMVDEGDAILLYTKNILDRLLAS